MTEHHCLHEAEIATLRSESTDVRQDISDIRTDLKEILACIKGNGKEGLMTRMALVEKNRSDQTWLTRTVQGGAILAIIYVIKDATLWAIRSMGG